MAQWTNLNRNNSFVNLRRLHLLCKISGAVHLVLVGLRAGWLADEIQVNLYVIDQNVRVFAVFNKDTALLQQYQCI